MDFLAQVKADISQITSTDFATAITFTPPGGPAKIIPGYASKHSIDVNEIGFISVNAKKATCSVTEGNMLAAGYVTRDINGNLLSFEKHTVTWVDVSGASRTYVVQLGGSKPDENTGLITFMLGYYKP